MTASELRQKYLDFFKSKGHTIIPSASLIPENDPSVLFTTAGMHPLVPYLLGEKHPEGDKVVNVQKCVRTVDIDEVGDACHHTFFEMMGNWSFGDYFKEKSIEMSWEFLTSPQWLGLDKNRIAISVFAGDSDAPFDEEAYKIWKKIGIPENKMAKLPKEKNWWGMETGPCGPDTEIFYWTGDPKKIPESFNDDDKLWVEIWNNVFMQYNKTVEGKFESLKQKNVDTGMGLERILSAVNCFKDDYKTELFFSIIKKIEEISKKSYEESEEVSRSMRIIADHLKAATFIMADDKNIVPSNVGQGYVVRRLIRRAIRYGKILGIQDESWTKEISKIVAYLYRDVYSELPRNIDKVLMEIEKEEDKFNKTLDRGLKQFEKMKVNDFISGLEAFDLYQTYGFPIEMTEELAREKGLKVDQEGFQKELKKHQDLSRTASAGMFKGGLADDSPKTRNLHTAAHLLLAALRKVLGGDIVQKGSNITPERLRFDFSYSEKMSKNQIAEVEKMVNDAINLDMPVICEEINLKDAINQGAMGIFKSKYGERVKVYTIQPGQSGPVFSKEICGGPHAIRTGELGKFKIVKEESSSAGVRRIKAILENF